MVLGLIVTVLVPEGEPAKTKTLKCPSDNVPLDVVKVCVVPESVIVPARDVRRSMI